MELIKVALLEPINWVIFIAGIIWLIAIIGKKKELRTVKKSIDKKTSLEEYDNAINAESLSIESHNVRTIKLDAMDKPREAFNIVCAKYGAWVQTISLFPLLGLLGTIIGMMPGLREMTQDGNVDVLYSSLSTALISTFLGLIASIGLKLLANFGPDKTIDDIEAALVEYDRKLEHLSAFNKFSRTEK